MKNTKKKIQLPKRGEQVKKNKKNKKTKKKISY